MMVYHNKEFGVRPRKTPVETFRKQNYWSTRLKQNAPPWYVWDTKNHVIRSRSEDRPPKSISPIAKHFQASGFINDLRNYLLTSTLHGLRYIGEKKLTWFERFFWLTAFGCSLVCAGFFILNVYAKWRLSPMIVSINPTNMPLHDLPFPAITICNVNQAKKSVAERYRDHGQVFVLFRSSSSIFGLAEIIANLNGRSAVDKKLLQSLCTTQDDTEIFEDKVALSADWDHTRSFLINVTQPCQEMLALCFWDSTVMNCEDLFNAQLTDEGLCCTFNVVHRNNMFRNPKSLNDLNITFPSPAVDWTPENGYPPQAPPDGFPWRPKGIGTQHGLSLVLDANIAEYYCASTQSAGFKILMHNPTETPKIRNLGDIFGPGVEARVAIQPKILDAQPALRSIDIKKRVCLFSDEKELVFFRTYTLKNCEMECEAHAMLEACQCVYYFMPKNKTTRICGKADAKCYSNTSLVMPEGREVECEECLPACTEIEFYEHLSTAPLKRNLVKQFAKAINKTTEYFTENMLVISFYFEDNTFMRFTKGEIFGLTEFLCKFQTNTGGLLGLCMGFSVMSAVELLYYLTLRALCIARRRRPKQPFVQ